MRFSSRNGIGENLVRVDHRRNHVAAEIVLAVGPRGVQAKLLEEKAGVEDVNAHRRQGMLRIARDRLRMGRLLLEAQQPVVAVDLHHAELRGRFEVRAEGADRQVGMRLDVPLDELHVVHLVDVVAGQDHDVRRPLLLDRVDVLVDGVGRALVPMLVDPLLRGHDVDELAQLAAQVTLPADVDVPVEAHRLVLREDQVLANAAVEAIREREVDDAIDAAERHRRLGAVAGQRLQPRTLAAGQDHREDFLHVDSIGHGQRSFGNSGLDRNLVKCSRPSARPSLLAMPSLQKHEQGQNSIRSPVPNE